MQTHIYDKNVGENLQFMLSSFMWGSLYHLEEMVSLINLSIIYLLFNICNHGMRQQGSQFMNKYN